MSHNKLTLSEVKRRFKASQPVLSKELEIVRYISSSNVIVRDKYGELKTSLHSIVKRGYKPSMSTAVDIVKYLNNKLKTLHPELSKEVVIVEFKSSKNIIVKDCYGYIRTNSHNLINEGCRPNIETAVDKVKYANSKLKHLQPHISKEVKIIKYIKASKIFTRDRYGICKTSSRIFYGEVPTVHVAVNKLYYYIEQVRQRSPKVLEGLKVLELLGEKVLVKDRFGECIVGRTHLMNGHPPTIQTAVNPTSYTVNKFKKVHGSRYDYSKVKYTSSDKKVKIICKEHGEFEQTVNGHLSSKGCSMCSIERRSAIQKDSNENFLNKAREIHGDLYTYLDEYRGSYEKLRIKCKHHGIFEMRPNSHLGSEQGCPTCARLISVAKNNKVTRDQLEESKNVPSGVYVMQLTSEDEVFWKVGISKQINKRVSSIVRESGYEVKVLNYIEMDLFTSVQIEDKMFKNMAGNNYKPKKYFKGVTECFSKDPRRLLGRILKENLVN